MNLWFMGLKVGKGSLWKEGHYDVILEREDNIEMYL